MGGEMISLRRTKIGLCEPDGWRLEKLHNVIGHIDRMREELPQLLVTSWERLSRLKSLDTLIVEWPLEMCSGIFEDAVEVC